MHIAVSGITSFQRALKMTLKSRSKTGAPANGVRYSDRDSFEWNELSSLNNLADVYKVLFKLQAICIVIWSDCIYIELYSLIFSSTVTDRKLRKTRGMFL